MDDDDSVSRNCRVSQVSHLRSMCIVIAVWHPPLGTTQVLLRDGEIWSYSASHFPPAHEQIDRKNWETKVASPSCFVCASVGWWRASASRPKNLLSEHSVLLAAHSALLAAAGLAGAAAAAADAHSS